MLDFGELKILNTMELVNTHGGPWRDASTKDFQVLLGENSDGPWQKIVSGSLEDARDFADPMPLEKYSFQVEF